jgi:hypothetical protein
MEKQNITLALARDILKRVKIMAAERDSSVSSLMEQLLIEQLTQHEGYNRAHHRQKARMEQGLDLGTGGTRSWTREELHER